MSVSVALNGLTYTLPSGQETGWGAQMTAFVQAVGSSTLQKSGGTFTLTADADFGATYGLKSNYFTSRTANAASAGVLRLARADTIKWRNQANGADLTLGVDSSNNLEWESVDVVTVSGTQTLTNKTLTSPTIATPTVTVEAWTALSYSNSWVNYGSSNPTAGYRKLPDGNVQMRGAIKNGTTSDGTTAFTLPSGYRPTGRILFAVKGTTPGLLEFSAVDGTVKVYSLTGSGELSLDGIIFPTT
jgi:hypothetical protein